MIIPSLTKLQTSSCVFFFLRVASILGNNNHRVSDGSIIDEHQSSSSSSKREVEDNNDDIPSSSSSCRLYMAPSTIPNSGYGIFAGIDYNINDIIIPSDIVIPLDNMPFHTRGDTNTNNKWGEGLPVFFLWSDYTWDNSIVVGSTFDYEGLGGDFLDEENNDPIRTSQFVEMVSPGLGSMPNCKFGFVNLETESAISDLVLDIKMDRFNPSNGAITPYHHRIGKAKEFVPQGSELFEDYGEEYFTVRYGLEHIPHQIDYEKADEILHSLRKTRQALLQQQQSNSRRRGRGRRRRSSSRHDGRDDGSTSIPVTSIIRDLYDIILSLKSSRPPPSSSSSSRTTTTWRNVLNVLPDQPQPHDDDAFFNVLLDNPSTYFEKKTTIRDIHWLRRNGICMDGIKAGYSDIPNAGRGAFATRDFQQGERIAPVPLIHIPNVDSQVLTKYEPNNNNNNHQQQRNTSKPIGTQLLLNYCFGHKRTTMLLSPYGHVTSLINHAPTTASSSGHNNNNNATAAVANAKMVWATKWMREPRWLQAPPSRLIGTRHAGLGFDLIALRDISIDEEILIDYGPDWEEAWSNHLSNWSSSNHNKAGTPMPYIPAKQLNENIEQTLLKIVQKSTDDDDVDDDFHGNVDYTYKGHGVSLQCYYYKSSSSSSSATLDLISLWDEEEEDDDDEQQQQNGENLNNNDATTMECRPIKAYKCTKTGEQLFVAEIVEWVEQVAKAAEDGYDYDYEEEEESDRDRSIGSWELVVRDVLFDASSTIFHFVDIPYNTAYQMPWSFRHVMAIPDELLPEAWINRP